MPTLTAAARARCRLHGEPGPVWKSTPPAEVASVLPMRFAVARGVKHDLIVLPEALEEGQGLALTSTALPGLLENLGQSSVPVDRAEQAIAGQVDGENEIGKWVGAVDQDGDAPPRDPLSDAN